MIRATKKFTQYGINWMQLDTFFLQQHHSGQIDQAQFASILKNLESVYGTTPGRRRVLLSHLKEESNND